MGKPVEIAKRTQTVASEEVMGMFLLSSITMQAFEVADNDPERARQIMLTVQQGLKVFLAAMSWAGIVDSGYIAEAFDILFPAMPLIV